MAFDKGRETIFATDETQELISSEKVDGTAVFSRDAERLGSIFTSWSESATAK